MSWVAGFCRAGPAHQIPSYGRCDLGKCLGDFSKCRILVRNYPPRAPHSWVFAGRIGKVKVTGSRWGNLVSPCVVQVPKDAVFVGGGGKSPGREKWVASFGTRAMGSAPDSLTKRARPGEMLGHHSEKQGMWCTASPMQIQKQRTRRKLQPDALSKSAEDVGFEPTRVVKPARVPGV